MDRHGGACTSALVGFGVAGVLDGPLWIDATMAALAGIAIPAITAAVRSWLPDALSSDSARGASYALLSALFQGAVTVGPVVVSVALLLHGPVLAVAVAAVLILAATVVYAFTCDRQPGSRAVASRRRADRSPGLCALLVAAGLAGLAVGVAGIAVPGIMTTSGVSAIAGAAFGALALGEMLGALLFGSRPWPGRRRVQLPAVQGLVALVAVLIFLVSEEPWLVVIAMFGAGVIGAPISILKSALLDEVVPQAALARSYSMLVAVGLISPAVGNAFAGLLVQGNRAGCPGRECMAPAKSASEAGSWWLARLLRVPVTANVVASASWVLARSVGLPPSAGRSVMLKHAREFFSAIFTPIASFLLRMGLTPNAVTVIGTVGVCSGALVLYPMGQLVWGTAVIALFAFSDILDGLMARIGDKRSVLGGFLDSVSDRVQDSAVFLGLLLYYFGPGEDYWIGVAAVVCMILGLLYEPAQNLRAMTRTPASPSARNAWC